MQEDFKRMNNLIFKFLFFFQYGIYFEYFRFSICFDAFAMAAVARQEADACCNQGNNQLKCMGGALAHTHQLCCPPFDGRIWFGA
jgi:hypothetical protein